MTAKVTISKSERTEAQRVTGEAERPSARELLDASMSEADWQTLVIDLAKRCGWLAHHQIVPFRRGRDGRVRAIVEPHTDKGFVDLVLAHETRGREIHVELKREGGKLSADQERWRDALILAGARWYCWQPSDFPEVCAVLEGT